MYETILNTETNEPPEVRAAKPLETGEGVIDGATFRTIEVDRLFDAVNYSGTLIGQSILYRSLARPLDSVKAIRMKQEAVRELQSNPELREKIEELLTRAAAHENNFYNLLYGTFLGLIDTPDHKLEIEGYGYESYRKGTRFMLDLVKDAEEMPTPESSYLKGIVDQIRGFAETRWHALMEGPAINTEKGFKTREEKGPFTPGFAFKPTLFKPLLITAAVAFVGLLYFLAPLASFGISSSAVPVLMLFSIPALMVYVPIVGTYDRDSCIYPLRSDFKGSSEIQQTVESLGKLDELWSFFHYAMSFDNPMMLPMIVDSDRYIARLKAAKNPILGKEIPNYVPNDVDSKLRLTFITGPNSGGKTAICKTIAQIQLLAQIGCPVPAKKAETAVADRIFYQVPEFSSLEDGEGRFGTELKRTKAIFMTTSPNSLVILDELSEGTTYEEKLETSSNVLNGFNKKGNVTILITHNHELVDRFIEQGIGQALQVEFKGDHPTFRLIEGVSRVSHADRVAKKIGFAKEDIEHYLQDDEGENRTIEDPLGGKEK